MGVECVSLLLAEVYLVAPQQSTPLATITTFISSKSKMNLCLEYPGIHSPDFTVARIIHEAPKLDENAGLGKTRSAPNMEHQ
jgi:hypothetical protein